MNTILLGIGDLGVSNHQDDIIKTFALGSCVAVTFWSPHLRIGGMVHIALPESKINLDKAKIKPGYFADTGITSLIQEIKNRDCFISNRDLSVKITGGAQVMQTNDIFNIGNRNISRAKEILKKQDIKISAEDTGGYVSRTVSLSVKTGLITLSSPGRKDWYL